MATALSRWLAPMILAAGLGVAAFAPAPAHADGVRVIVDLGDVIFRDGYPYYRHGGYGPRDRLVVVRDRWGRPVYYRTVYRAGPPYGHAYGHWRGPKSKCDRYGRCAAYWYDARYDRDRHNHRYHDRDRHYDRYDRHRRWDRD
ncbi:hypothetical protein [Vulcaniibacterium tengchongense]|uniref:PXPV repeat-containing protein n=1 Tax=Vulcaniibacterium tengchongense TaxID=1273429 RepID=A0A3N4VKA7_9GAMM|nr:hypothetical protein [Vulcaniibacterium tengchongense]RPE79691.1 hypothetical protein EDC50_1515 [Vulcaniibacterium tengchongense]